MNLVISDLLGLGAGLLGMISSVPQMYKTIKTNETKDLHIFTCILRITSAIMWILFGYIKIQYIIIVTGSVNFGVELLLIFFILKSREYKCRSINI